MKAYAKRLQDVLLTVYDLFDVMPQKLELVRQTDEILNLILQQFMADMAKLQQLLIHFEFLLLDVK